MRKIYFFIVGIALYSQAISKITEETLQSQSIGAGGQVQGSFGTAWGASGYGSGSSGKGTYKQVQEQSGLFAEEGGYHINANNVHLRGGAIASTTPTNSELTTNRLTFEDIQNRSQSQGISGGISGSANLTNAAGNESQSHKEGGENQAKERTNATQSNGISPSLPMVSRESDSSMTKATLTEGKITLNKDTNPTQTTAKALGINTELSQANQQIEQPKDINKMLKEQQTFAQSAGNVAGAVNAYANQRAEEARAKAEEAKSSGNLTAYTQAKAEQESWEQGGRARRNAQTVANVIHVALAGGNAGAVGVAAVSPYLNEKIKEATTEENGEVNKPANLLGHAILGAIEAKATGNNALAGAASGAVGEGTAMIAKEVLYKDKPTSELNESERQNIVSLSQIASGLAGAVVGDSSQNTVVGAEIGKRAVENNYLKSKDIQSWVRSYENAKTAEEREALIEKVAYVDDAYLMEALETRISKKELINRRADLEGLRNNVICQQNCQMLANNSITQLNLLIENYDKLQQEKAKSVAPTLALSMLTMGSANIISKLPKLIDKPVIIAGGFSAGSEFAGQLIENDGDISQVDAKKVLISTGTGIATKNMGAIGVGATNAGVEALDSLRTGKNPISESITSGFSSLVGAKAGAVMENRLDKRFNPKWKEYTFEDKYVPYPIQVSPEKNYIPSISGNALDNFISPLSKSQLDKSFSEGENGK